MHRVATLMRSITSRLELVFVPALVSTLQTNKSCCDNIIDKSEQYLLQKLGDFSLLCAVAGCPYRLDY